MGRPIAGQYRVPVSGMDVIASIDPERMTMQIGDELFEKPSMARLGLRIYRLNGDGFWNALHDGEPKEVEKQNADSAYIYLKNPIKGKMIIKMFLVDHRKIVRTTRA